MKKVPTWFVRSMHKLWMKIGVIIISGTIGTVVCWLIPNSVSQYTLVYQANAKAADEFMQMAETEWPVNRDKVYTKLELLRRAYLRTDENDPWKLEEIERLQMWAATALSVAEEQAFLTEVRTHGRIIETRPIGMSLMYFVVSGMFGLVFLWILRFQLEIQDPRIVAARYRRS